MGLVGLDDIPIWGRVWSVAPSTFGGIPPNGMRFVGIRKSSSWELPWVPRPFLGDTAAVLLGTLKVSFRGVVRVPRDKPCWCRRPRGEASCALWSLEVVGWSPTLVPARTLCENVRRISYISCALVQLASLWTFVVSRRGGTWRRRLGALARVSAWCPSLWFRSALGRVEWRNAYRKRLAPWPRLPSISPYLHGLISFGSQSARWSCP